MKMLKTNVNNNYDFFNNFEQLSIASPLVTNKGSFFDNTVHNDNEQSNAASSKSQNVTDCVPVPSSEHVAEIVGRQGCKIKALRAKTNTYIKTPIRGESPMFVITGRREDVNMAKKEILSAADHFSQIRARRNNSNVQNAVIVSTSSTLEKTQPPTPSTSPSLLSSSSSTSSTCMEQQDRCAPTTSTTNIVNIDQQSPPPPPPQPGQLTIQVRVPYRVVGLVVGPKGSTIKRIQQQTQTYIITPSRDREPVFEITGQSANVETARTEIEAYIQLRTKSVSDEDRLLETDDIEDFLESVHSPSTSVTFKSTLNDSTFADILNQPQIKQNSDNILSVSKTLLDFNQSSIWSSNQTGVSSNANIENVALINHNSLFNNIYRSSSSSSSSSCSSSASASLSSSTTNCKNNQNTLQSLLLSSTQPMLQLFDFAHTETFVEDSPHLTSSLNEISQDSATYMMQLMMQDMKLQFSASSNNQKCRLCDIVIRCETFDSELACMLLPCRHSAFCTSCAQNLVDTHQHCPICFNSVTQAMSTFL